MAHIEANNELQAIDRIAAEILQLVTAGLSNIRRHTQAIRAIIDLSQSHAHFILQIANDGGEGRAFGHVMPRSTAKRAAAFGRQVRMERQGMEDPAVVINIPL